MFCRRGFAAFSKNLVTNLKQKRIIQKLRMKIIQLLTILICLTCANETFAQQVSKQKEILLIGTFHFHNPGADIAKTDKFNVLTEGAQKELQIIAERIKDFAPDKIFVEWDFNDADALDSLYNLYLNNNYFDYVNKKYPKSTFYKENEIFQLAFRAAKLSGNKKVYGIDVQTDFSFDSLLLAIDRANQTELKDRIFNRVKEFEQIDNENRKRYSLTKLILECNKQGNRDFDLGSYITMFNTAGKYDDFTWPALVANWYKRNLLMYSFVQKLTEKNDDKIVVLLGASHIALLKQFADLDENFKVVELSDILNKK